MNESFERVVKNGLQTDNIARGKGKYVAQSGELIRAKVLEWFQNPAFLQDVAKEHGMNYHTLRYHVRALAREGKITRDPVPVEKRYRYMVSSNVSRDGHVRIPFRGKPTLVKDIIDFLSDPETGMAYQEKLLASSLSALAVRSWRKSQGREGAGFDPLAYKQVIRDIQGMAKKFLDILRQIELAPIYEDSPYTHEEFGIQDANDYVLLSQLAFEYYRDKYSAK